MSWMSILTTIVLEFNRWVIYYFGLLNGVYLLLFLVSFVEVMRFVKRTFFSDYEQILKSEMTWPISIVIPAYNEARNIVDTVPGRSNYSPLWQVQKVTWAEGATPRALKSAAQVRSASSDGELTIERTTMVVNCPVLRFGQVRHPGFSRGKTIHYYDLGPVKVRPGNEVVPLWTVTNGVTRQLNVADVRPGQTAYPPLWAIIKVTWKPSASKRLLTSLGAIRRAQSAGEVTLAKTSLVVNCPLV